MSDLVIIGAGGHAREIHELVEDLVADGARWNMLGFLDDNPALHGTALHGLPVLGGLDWLAARPEVSVVIAIGATPAKRRVALRVRNPFATLVHPQATVGRRVSLGEGCTVCMGARLTTDVTLGAHVIVNVNASVSHDAVLGDYVTLAPGVGLAGAVTVGTGCDVGLGAQVIQGLSIGEWSIVGAGAVVVRDLPANVTAVGVPARALKQRAPGWHV